MQFLMMTVALAGATEDKTWQRTLDRVTPAVVSLRVTATRDFDTEDARSSVGTGFLVDAERGLILVRGGVPGHPTSLVQIQTAKTGGAK